MVKVVTTHPIEKANIISRLFFWWTIPLFWKGARNNLSREDLYVPLVADSSEILGNRLETEWKIELQKLKNVEYKISKDGNKIKSSSEPSLGRAIIRTFWFDYISSTVLSLINFVILRTLQPLLQSVVVRYFDIGHNISSKQEVLLYATGLILTIFFSVFITHHVNSDTQRLGMQIRIACSSLLYRKSLNLSKASLEKTTPGQVINLLSNDVSRFDFLPMFLFFILITPLQIIVVGCIMWHSIGISTLIGIGTLLLIAIPLQIYISKRGAQLRAIIARLTDRRVQLMNELIAGIQVIKTYAWEKPFSKFVSQIRHDEINKIKVSSYFRGLYLGLMILAERITLFFSIVSFVLANNTMTAEVTFELASYFNVFQLSCTICLPQALILFGEAFISIKRLEKYLLLDEVNYNTCYDNTSIIKQQHGLETDTEKNSVFVEFYEVSANWTLTQLPPTICNISLRIEGGKLCILTGPVGAGKSSLLNILLQELPLGAGRIRLLQYSDGKFKTSQIVRGFIKDNLDLKISFASQDAWLFSGTIRENILFGEPYDRIRYQQVTQVCSLLRDFKQLPNGDMTIIGDRGASLSGGQRARVNLARAIYSQADLYLLDDPLSAVDARVARRLFNDCIVGFLKGKTRILVTHQLNFFNQADTIIKLEKGLVKYQGTFNKLINSNEDFNEMLNQFKENETRNSTIQKTVLDEIVDDLNEIHGMNFYNDKSYINEATKPRMSQKSIKSIASYCFDWDEEDSHLDKNSKTEVILSGRLSTSVYIRYFRAGTRLLTLLLLILTFLLGQVLANGVDYWLSYWTNIQIMRTWLHKPNHTSISENREYLNIANNSFFNYFSILDQDGLLSTEYAIYIYTFFLALCIILIVFRSMLFMMVCMNASTKLHHLMFSNILQAPMYFFNNNPSGRILNRFSKDIGAIDELLPKNMLESIQIFLVVVGILVMIIIVNYWMCIPTIIVLVIFYFTRNYYLNTAQDIKRLESTVKSPVFSHVAATMNGLTTIRSSGEHVELMLRKEFDKFQDEHTSAWYMTIVTASAFGLFLDIISSGFIACVCYSLIFMNNGSTMSGWIGLAISQSMILTGMLQYGIRQSTDVQAQMTAVERIIEYTDLPQESTGSGLLPKNWPSLGSIQFKNVFMSYMKDEPPVLKDLNLIMEPGWKVGVVGRTGAGKSSLIQALFRLTGDGLEGQIFIDQIDTKTVDLGHLRSCISIIPQEPVLFSASLRYNLDPFEKYDNNTLYNVLRKVELTDMSLDQIVTEGGTNFSVGQRQLICLARAILRNNRILVLDEATANIDSRTDELIQHTIRTNFSECTVITIAHRLNTIIDSDRIIVMDGGRIMEYDSSYELLSQNPPSLFAKLVQETGSAMANKLFEMASSHYHKRNRSFSINSIDTMNV